MKQIIPNTLTITNLFCGCLTLICLLSNQDVHLVPLLMGFALLGDYTDGLVARLLNATSELGKQLDSLSDMVSFGVVPGAMLFYMINRACGIEQMTWSDTTTLWGIVGFVVSIFSCIRLAKFNLDDRQSDTFIGLGTPACAILVLGLLQISLYGYFGLDKWVLKLPVLYGFVALLSYLLIAEIPMFSFKFKNLKWSKNKIRILFILHSLVMIVALPLGLSLFFIIFNYILISLILWAVGIIKLRKIRVAQRKGHITNE